MVEHGKIFKCEDCGSIVEVLVDAHEEKDCCDSSKNVIEPQTEGDKAPKHVPVISVDGNEVTVAVGEVQHPMDDDHFIQFVELIVGDERYISNRGMFQKLPLLLMQTYLLQTKQLQGNFVTCTVFGLLNKF